MERGQANKHWIADGLPAKRCRADRLLPRFFALVAGKKPAIQCAKRCKNSSAGQFLKARVKLNRFLSLAVAVFRRNLLLPRRIILRSVVSKRDESTDFD